MISCYAKEAISVQPPNQYFSLSAKMDGTQRRALVIHEECIAVYACQKAPLRLKRHRTVKIKPVALAVIELR